MESKAAKQHTAKENLQYQKQRLKAFAIANTMRENFIVPKKWASWEVA